MEGKTGLYRSSRDKMIGGIAAGIAEYLNIDPTVVRILFVLLALVGGGGAILYAILWIVLPTDENITSTYNNFNNMEENKDQENNPNAPFQPNDPKYRKKDDGSLIAGLILISLGIIFLVIRYFPRIDFSDLWPVILIVIGVVLLRNAITSKKQ